METFVRLLNEYTGHCYAHCNDCGSTVDDVATGRVKLESEFAALRAQLETEKAECKRLREQIRLLQDKAKLDTMALQGECADLESLRKRLAYYKDKYEKEREARLKNAWKCPRCGAQHEGVFRCYKCQYNGQLIPVEENS
jgi:ribosomal protein S27AE